jgi:hypothetical protein
MQALGGREKPFPSNGEGQGTRKFKFQGRGHQPVASVSVAALICTVFCLGRLAVCSLCINAIVADEGSRRHSAAHNRCDGLLAAERHKFAAIAALS